MLRAMMLAGVVVASFVAFPYVPDWRAWTGCARGAHAHRPHVRADRCGTTERVVVTVSHDGRVVRREHHRDRDCAFSSTGSHSARIIIRDARPAPPPRIMSF